jgi:hypothetical protein
MELPLDLVYQGGFLNYTLAGHGLFHPQNVPISAKLSADLGERADFFESKSFVEGVRSGVRPCNSSDHAMHVLLRE